MVKTCRELTYLTDVGKFPSNFEADFGNDIQGVTHDDNSWYLTRTQGHNLIEGRYGQVARIPVGTRLDDEKEYHVESEPNDWHGDAFSWGPWHYGSPTFAKNRLLVPIDESGDATKGCYIGVISPELKHLELKKLRPRGGCGWLARNPRDELFYVTSVNGKGIARYANDTAWVGTRFFSSGTGRGFGIQGAAFSERGILWVVTNEVPRIYAIDVNTGFAYYRGGVRGPEYSDPVQYEGEGLTLWDLTDGRAPGVGGHLHVQILRNDVSDDAVTFWHLHADRPEAL